MKYFIVFLLSVTVCLSEEQFWEHLAVPHGGEIERMFITPGDTIYALGKSGIARSIDYAHNWEVFKQGDFTSFGSFAVNSKNHIFAFAGFYNTVMIRSTDLGVTWDTLHSVWDWLDLEHDYRKRIMFINVGNNDNLYIYSFYYNLKLECWLFAFLASADSGETWEIIDSMQSNKESNRQEIYAYNDSIYTIVRLLDDGWEVKSTSDKGKTYHSFFSSPRNYSFKDIQYISKDKVFMGFMHQLLYSEDAGKTWSKLNTHAGYIPPSLEWASVGPIRVITENEIILSQFGVLYYTSNQGATWELISNDTIGSRNVKLDSKGNIYLATGYGVFRSTTKEIPTDFTRHNNGFYNYRYVSQPYWHNYLVIDRNGDIYITGDGITISRDKGNTWETVYLDNENYPRLPRVFSLFLLNDGTLLAHSEIKSARTLYRSTDAGRSWELWNDNLPRWDFSDMIELDDGTLIANIFNALYKSTDRGKTFNKTSPNSSYYISLASNGNIVSVNSNGFYLSTDRGDTWERRLFRDTLSTFEWPGLDWMKLQMHNKTGYGWAIGSLFPSLYITKDYGYTWEYLSHYPHSYSISAIDSAGNIWIADFCRSIDSGATWEKMYHNIPSFYSWPTALAVCPEGYVYALVSGGGLYRSKQRYVSVSEPVTSKDRKEFTIIPNPASDYIEINVENTHLSFQQQNIKIYNIYGECVTDLTPALSEGESVRFNVSHLPVGVYYLRIGNSAEKFIVVR